MAAEQDWLAYIPMGAGGTWARGEDREDTIRRAVKMCRSDWGGLYQFSGEEIDILVADVRGHDHVRFDPNGVWTVAEDSDGNSPAARTYLDQSLVEVVTHTYPGKKASR